jgi:hypothetical protein
MSARKVTLPYSTFVGPESRPYLQIHLTGPTGSDGDVIGLIDSGADTSCLPLGYASLLGYKQEQLQLTPCVGVGGACEVFEALEPLEAYVLGLQDAVFEMRPTFLPDSHMALWGRQDFFKIFGVCFDEPSEEFTLTCA